LAAPIEPAARIIHNLGTEQARLLLQHFAAEQNRAYFYLWEQIEIPLGLLLALCLFLATQRRMFPLILSGIMLSMVLLQYMAITPELVFSGRRADFPPLSEAFGAQARMWGLNQVYWGLEISKLVVGVILAGYIFAFRPHRQNRRRTDADDIARPAPLELRDF